MSSSPLDNSDRRTSPGRVGAPVVVRASIAGAAEGDVASRAHAAGLSGFVCSGTGFGEPYPVEPCVIVESATHDVSAFLEFVVQELVIYGQQSAYMTRNGAPSLLSIDGEIEPIPAHVREAGVER